MSGTEFVITPERVTHFMLVVARLGGVVIAAPLFGHQGVPLRVRAAMTLAVAIGIAGFVPIGSAAVIRDALSFTGVVLMELATGAMFGMAAQLIFTGVLLGGQLAGIHMGLGLARVIDPRTNLQATPIALWFEFVALQVFLSMDGHHLLIRALMRSFELIPPGQLHLTAASVGMFSGWVGGAFEIAAHIAAPVVGGLIIADTAMGLLARAIPQLNVFIMGFAIKIGMGFLILSASLPFTIRFIGRHFAELDGTLFRLLGSLS